VVDVYDGYPLENNLSGNVVDICPVGALISKDFLYSARVWFQKQTDSICTGCSRGCSIEVQTKDNRVRRLTARHNPHTNGYWMCDHGRYDIDYVLGERRSLRYRLGASTAPADAGKALGAALKGLSEKHGGASLGILASAFLTLEEAFLLNKLGAALGVPVENVGAWARPDGREETFKGGFRIAADKNPNKAGVRRILGADVFERRAGVLDRLARGELRGLIAVSVSDRPHCLAGEGPGEEGFAAALAGLELAVVFQLEHGVELPPAALVLPATAFVEKDGTLVNDQGRVQRLRPATELPRGIRPEIEVLQEALRGLGAWDRQVSAAGVFRELAPGLGLAGTGYKEIGNLGVELPEAR
jgi:NADH-quinone oxidoreductase subunit G